MNIYPETFNESARECEPCSRHNQHGSILYTFFHFNLRVRRGGGDGASLLCCILLLYGGGAVVYGVYISHVVGGLQLHIVLFLFFSLFCFVGAKLWWLRCKRQHCIYCTLLDEVKSFCRLKVRWRPTIIQAIYSFARNLQNGYMLADTNAGLCGLSLNAKWQRNLYIYGNLAAGCATRQFRSTVCSHTQCIHLVLHTVCVDSEWWIMCSYVTNFTNKHYTQTIFYTCEREVFRFRLAVHTNIRCQHRWFRCRFLADLFCWPRKQRRW